MPIVHQPVILTRPGAANDRLAQALGKEGISAWCWPVFQIRLPEDEALVARRFANLEDVDMVVMVSPAAVASVAHWVQDWPEHITLATVGEGTARVIRAAWGDDVPLVFPQGSAETSGSEALLSELQRTGIPRRVLIARGQTGREWLREQLCQLGVDVEIVTTYERVPIELSKVQIETLRRAVAGPSPIVYLTSSDAVATLLHAVKVVRHAREWLVSGKAITIHPRCVQRLKEAGFAHVELTEPDDVSVAHHIRANLLSLT